MGLTDAGIVIAQDYGAVQDQPPTITSTPAPVFTEGVAATYDLTQHVSDDGLSAVTYGLTNTLPNGLVLDTAAGVLSYDGMGGASVSAHTLTATDGVGSAESASFGVTIQSSAGTDIALAAKRYDGGSGLAVFTGVIPLQQAQVSAGGLSGISLFNGGTELPISVTSLDLTHPDGTLKAVKVDAQLSAADETEIPLTLRLGQAPTAGSVTPVEPDDTWMTAPRLLACTDPAHLCKSHIALGPLVPIDTPALPAAWVTALTTEFDGTETSYPGYGRPISLFLAGTTNTQQSPSPWPNYASGATYNALYPMYCRYLVSGEIDRLRHAHGIAGWSEGFPFTMRELSHTECVTDADTSQTFSINPDYPNPPNGSSGLPAALSEWNSGNYRDCYLCWALSGWKQARGALIGYGLRNIQNARSANANPSQYGGRFDWRYYREAAIYLRLLNVDQRLRYSLPGVFTVTAEAASNTSWWESHFQTHHYDKYETWSRTFDISDERYNVWGNEVDFDPTGGGAGTYLIPTFQYITVFYTIYFLMQNVYQDATNDGWARLQSLVEFLENRVAGPWSGAWGKADTLYGVPYRIMGTLPTGLGGDQQYSCSMLIPAFAWAYARTGDTRYRDVIDTQATNGSWIINNAGSAGTGWKQIGEYFGGLFHAAAWRAGVAFDGWDL